MKYFYSLLLVLLFLTACSSNHHLPNAPAKPVSKTAAENSARLKKEEERRRYYQRMQQERSKEHYNARRRAKEEQLYYEAMKEKGRERVFVKKAKKKARKKVQNSGLLATASSIKNLLTKEEVKRYPTIESPDEVDLGDTFSVLVSLTEELLTPTVKVTQGKTDSEGRLQFTLPKQPDNKDWSIDVVLSASGFKFLSPNKATINLPKSGDSTPAMFQLRVKSTATFTPQRRLYATFWHKGQYLARVMKPIVVSQNDQVLSQSCSASYTLSQESRLIAEKTEMASIDKNRNTADLTIYMRRDWDSCSATDYFITLSSPHTETQHERIVLPENISEWILPQYKNFSMKGRGLNLTGQNSSGIVSKDEMLGFGKLLYKKIAPQSLRNVYKTLHNKLGERFKSIQVYTDDPSIPWELMVPDANNSFLGIHHTIGRWVIPRSSSEFTVPRQKLAIKGIRLIVPDYKGSLKLASTPGEAEYISDLKWGSKVTYIKGNYSSLKTALNVSQSTLIHYAGHGYTSRDKNKHITDYGLILEDTRLRSLSWRGMLGSKTNPSFVFFNACEVGQSEKAAGFVDGWSTTLTDTGSSGFISGLWELGDQGAAEFSKRFYTSLKEQFKNTGKASIATAMITARQFFLKTGNPTYLAYVYYGDPNLELTEVKAVASFVQDSKYVSGENIQVVFDRYKAALYRIYNRELRTHPGLKGKIVFKISISADGSVGQVTIDSSDIHSDRLKKKMIHRIKRYHFGAQNSNRPVTVLYPLELMPAY